MSFDYFYGSQSESFSFYRIPRVLVTGERYRGLSTDAKLLYGLMLDRMGLSAKNGWLDEQGRVYIYYTIDEIKSDLCCGSTKAVKLLKELDTPNGIGLIERRKQGQGKPACIYVKQFTEAAQEKTGNKSAKSRVSESESLEFRKAKVCDFEKEKSGLTEVESPDFSKAEANYTDKKQTEKSYTDPSIYRSDRSEIEDEVREQIDYELIAEQYPYDDPECILELICEVLSCTAGSIKIGSENLPSGKVKARFRRLNHEHIAYVLDSLRENTTQIKNIRAYLLTALYNAPLTIGPYYAAAVRHDFG